MEFKIRILRMIQFLKGWGIVFNCRLRVLKEDVKIYKKKIQKNRRLSSAICVKLKSEYNLELLKNHLLKASLLKLHFLARNYKFKIERFQGKNPSSNPFSNSDRYKPKQTLKSFNDMSCFEIND